jgi:hypothetical protein
MTTNWKNKKLMEEGKLPKLPEKAPSPAPPPRKDYPLFAHAEHSHPYAIAANRIHALEWANKEKDKVIAQMEGEAVALRRLNLSLRLLAIHGLIYRLDSLIKEEMGKTCPNVGRIQRWSAEVGRLRVSYETLKESKLKGGR